MSDGELDEPAAASVHDHLRSCAECRSFLEDLLWLRRLHVLLTR